MRLPWKKGEGDKLCESFILAFLLPPPPPLSSSSRMQDPDEFQRSFVVNETCHFITPLSNFDTCAVCLSVVRRSVFCSTGHSTCRSCLEEHIKINKLQRPHHCPACRQPFPHGDIGACADDSFMQLKLSKYQVRCPRHEQGCEWQGPWGTDGVGLESHVSSFCAYRTGKCWSRGCGVVFYATEQARNEHKTVCSYLLVPCPWCKCVFKRLNGEYDSHVVDCPQRPLPCPHACVEGETFAQGHLMAHVEDFCPRAPQVCFLCRDLLQFLPYMDALAKGEVISPPNSIYLRCEKEQHEASHTDLHTLLHHSQMEQQWREEEKMEVTPSSASTDVNIATFDFPLLTSGYHQLKTAAYAYVPEGFWICVTLHPLQLIRMDVGRRKWTLFPIADRTGKGNSSQGIGNIYITRSSPDRLMLSIHIELYGVDGYWSLCTIRNLSFHWIDPVSTPLDFPSGHCPTMTCIPSASSIIGRPRKNFILGVHTECPVVFHLMHGTTTVSGCTRVGRHFRDDQHYHCIHVCNESNDYAHIPDSSVEQEHMMLFQPNAQAWVVVSTEAYDQDRAHTFTLRFKDKVMQVLAPSLWFKKDEKAIVFCTDDGHLVIMDPIAKHNPPGWIGLRHDPVRNTTSDVFVHSRGNRRLLQCAWNANNKEVICLGLSEGATGLTFHSWGAFVGGFSNPPIPQNPVTL